MEPPQNLNNPAWFRRYENMERPVETKPAIYSKEIWGAIVKVIGLILAAFGIVHEPQFLLDGWQWPEDLVPLVGSILAVIGQAWEKYGARAAVTLISGIFRTKW